MKFHRHLFLREVKIPASSEWMDATTGWLFVRLDKGAAYWLGKGVAKELNPGDVLLVAPGVDGQLRASQICDVFIHYFHFCPELANSFLTLAERHFLERIVVTLKGLVRVLPSKDPAAAEFAKVASGAEVENTLLLRCQMLEIVARSFADDIADQQPLVTTNASAEQRFKAMIQQMPDNELINHTPEQLAELCGCSLRHLSRLFRKHFGATIRARQTEIRLLKARQLLTDPNAKIMHVALESGYRHLGLFNFIFKKYVGLTPSEWRLQHARSTSDKSVPAVAVEGESEKPAKITLKKV